MKNLRILIFKYFFFRLASLREVKQSISRSISFFLTIFDLKMISKKILSSVNLTKTQAFLIHELTKVIMVKKNKTLVFGVF